MKILNYVKITSLMSLLLLSLSSVAIEPVFSNFGKAIRGFDPVAYFASAKPVKGLSALTHQYNGANWYFTSAKNRDIFIANPQKYAPQYGGYCAYAVSRGYTASTDPQAWTIVDDKLYLNYSLPTKAIWSKDIPGNIKKANRHWPKLLGQ